MLAAAGCATDKNLKDGAYLEHRIETDKPTWAAAHGPLETDEAVVRVYHDIVSGDKVSIAINKECQ